MPREQVTRNEDRVTGSKNDKLTTEFARNVHVGWTAGSVQLAILTSDTSGLWSENLTRRDINSTIAALRRARDKAFGEDE